MSVGYAEAAPMSFAAGTGADLYDAAWLYPDELEADRRRTHIAPSNISDPVLRDVLAGFHDALIHQISDIASRIAVPYRRTDAVLSDYAGLWLPSFYLVTPFVGTVPSPIISTTGSFIAWDIGFQVNARLGFTDVVGEASKKLTSTSAPAQLVVDAVSDIAGWLGLSVADVLKASGIRKRTYQAWKAGTQRSRAASEGRVWELHQLAADLVETMGSKGARSWLQQASVRDMLHGGDIDGLTSRAYATGSAPRPPWVGAGSIESHVVSALPVSIGPMDPNDVVEPES
jgi:uncharacterized protein (DUF2384 family)